MKKYRMNFNRSRRSAAFTASFIFLALIFSSLKAQKTENPYPKEVRGYKVVEAKVEVKKQKDSQTDKTPTPNDNTNQTPNNSTETDALVQVGEPKLVRVTPLGVTFEIPVTVAAVKQGGKVELLVFEDVNVNKTMVTIEDYTTSFDIPNDRAKELPRPISVFVSTPNALMNVLGEAMNSQETWQVKGRVFVCGRYNKFIFKFKRAVPIEFDVSITNPIRLKDKIEKASPRKLP